MRTGTEANASGTVASRTRLFSPKTADNLNERDMTELKYRYSYKEYGWESDEIRLTGNIMLLISFGEKALVTIKQRGCKEDEKPKCLITEPEKDFEITVKKDADKERLTIITSKRPKFIRYAYI